MNLLAITGRSFFPGISGKLSWTNPFFFLVFLIFPGCGSGDSRNNLVFSPPAEVILFEEDVSLGLSIPPGQNVTYVYFEGRLRNIGGQKSLNNRIHFYVGEDNHLLETSLCPGQVIGALSPGGLRPFSILAQKFDYLNYDPDVSFNSYEILWDDYTESVQNQVVPRLDSVEVLAAIDQSTIDSGFDVLRFFVDFKDLDKCNISFENIPVEIELDVKINGASIYQETFSEFSSAEFLANYPWFREGINVALLDIGADVASLIDQGSVSIIVKTPNQGVFSASGSSISKCGWTCRDA